MRYVGTTSICHLTRSLQKPRIRVGRGLHRRPQSTIPQSDPKTYFQDAVQPQELRRTRPSYFWRILRGSAIAIVAFGAGLITDIETQELEESSDPAMDSLDQMMALLAETFPVQWFRVVDTLLRPDIQLDEMTATRRLQAGSGMSLEPGHVTQVCVLPSSAIDEGEMVCTGLAGSIQAWGLFDAHNGRSSSTWLAHTLCDRMREGLADHVDEYATGEPSSDSPSDNVVPDKLGQLLYETLVGMNKSLQANIEKMVKSDVVELALLPFANMASSSPSALFTVYDHISRRIWVASLGDSVAVAGTWSEQQQKWLAIPMLPDVGNEVETTMGAARDAHPAQDSLNSQPRTLPGLVTTGVIGDMGSKVSKEDSQQLHQISGLQVTGPQSDDRKAPYVLGNSAIYRNTIDLEPKQDFVIMASRSFWDQMGYDQAVQCVLDWKDKFDPVEIAKAFVVAEQHDKHLLTSPSDASIPKKLLRYNEGTGRICWPNSREHWVTERSNCAEHLIQNALGGSQRNLVNMLINTPPGLAQSFYGDLTVMVIFFNNETSADEMPGMASRNVS